MISSVIVLMFEPKRSIHKATLWQLRIQLIANHWYGEISQPVRQAAPTLRAGSKPYLLKKRKQAYTPKSLKQKARSTEMGLNLRMTKSLVPQVKLTTHPAPRPSYRSPMRMLNTPGGKMGSFFRMTDPFCPSTMASARSQSCTPASSGAGPCLGPAHA